MPKGYKWTETDSLGHKHEYEVKPASDWQKDLPLRADEWLLLIVILLIIAVAEAWIRGCQ